MKHACLFLALSLYALGQSATKPSAREIFYSEPDPEPKAKAQESTKSKSGDKVKHVAKSTQAPVHATPEATPEVTQVVLAKGSSTPLGIRLTLLKIVGNGQTIEVGPDANFKPGERVRVNVQVTEDGYLFIVNRGSSGTWTQLFPSPELPNASNAVSRGNQYQIPSDRGFVVSDPPGEEKLFVILSRRPDVDMESLTLDLSQRDKKKSEKPLQKIYAMNDATVDRLRNAYSRDLIIEKVDQQTPGSRKENAIYVVNPQGGEDSRVVLDVAIKHP